MSDPTLWPGGGEVQSPDEARAAALLMAARASPSWSPASRREVLRRVRAEVDGPAAMRIAWQPAGAIAAAVVVLALAAVVHHRRVTAAPAAVTASIDAEFSWAADEGPEQMLALVIRAGTLDVEPRDSHRAIALHAPGLEAQVEAQSFRVEVAAETTTLTLGEGQAWVGKVVHLHHHESIRSDNPRLKRRSGPRPAAPSAPSAESQPAPTPALGAPAAAPASCASTGSIAERRSCYVVLSRGNDLNAQNALFELGMLDQEERHAGRDALGSFQDYEARFPKGPLASDASFAALTELLAERRLAEARSEGERFLAAYPRDPRAAEVRSRLSSLP